MSADDRIVVQQNSAGRWVAQHCFNNGDDLPDPEKVPYAATWQTLDFAIEMNRDRARETEYGFVVVEGHKTKEKVKTFSSELNDLLVKYGYV